MEFERVKLIKEYQTDPPKVSDGGEAAPSPAAEGEEKPVFVDYMYAVKKIVVFHSIKHAYLQGYCWSGQKIAIW